ncbi:MAG: helix-turn-helix domain-containing protein [Marmoricola sp.]
MDSDGEPAPRAGHRVRQEESVLQAKAASHPLRLRILRLCGQQAMTNKQLADRLDSQPGTTLYHVRLLVAAGFLEQTPIRTGASGALEKPYRSTGLSWWLSGDRDLAQDLDDVSAMAPIQAFQQELREAGPRSVRTFSRFTLHLSREQIRDLDHRIVALLDEYAVTDHERIDQPALGGIFVLHQLADPTSPQRLRPDNSPPRL